MENEIVVQKSFIRKLGKTSLKAVAVTAAVVGGVLLVNQVRGNGDAVTTDN